MTWTLYWTVIGIAYPVYYALNIAYDLWLSHIKKGTAASKESHTTYDVSRLFGSGGSVQTVSVEPYDMAGITPQYDITAPYASVESQKMTVDEFLEEVNKKNSDRVSGIFG